MPTFDSEVIAPPDTMRAAVYTGQSTVSVEQIPTPKIGPGELLIQVESCGICHTDLKKIEYNLLAPPRVFGHETAGIVAAVGRGVRDYSIGDRVVVFHHIPCRECFYCRHKLYAQCATYKKVGVTAGYEPAGGGFSQYVRAMDWIVPSGVEKIPAGVSFDSACFVEPLNTCLKGVVQMDLRPEDVVVILGQGPIGLLFTMLVKRQGSTMVTTDTMPHRRELSTEFGAAAALDPRDPSLEERIQQMTGGRGADAVIVAASAPGIAEQAVRYSRPGARILLFAQTSHKERIELSGADICVGERTIFGSYSASIDIQKESAELIFSGALPVERLISNRFPLNEIRQGIELALHPQPQSLKIVVRPQE
ncbi:MAG TPA: alcohol dehydrogenase catalytic domain-containing protein [Bryobacteraceae bacterium]|nr:alcohol dehydrogenase catalytic domain-containing protein [Bryobacteraceae bacterium]